MNWENLKKYKISTKLNRKPEIQKAYDNEKKNIIEIIINIY